MRLTRLTAQGVRNLAPLDLQPGPGLNLVLGDNGAGKTSLLEAVHLLAYGRSFRGRVRDGLVQTGVDALEVFAEWEEPRDVRRRAGLRHTGQVWTGRLDGESVQQLGDLCAALAAITFEPGSHTLVAAGSEARRRYLDWGLFHVDRDGDQAFRPVWRRYARALKQRNALLKQRAPARQLDAWDAELASAAEQLDRQRSAYVERLQPSLETLSLELLPQLGGGQFAYRPGWRRDQLALADALLLARERDLAAGFTSVGPHRADWRITHAARPAGEALSRGQAKLTALACLLAQAEDFAAQRGHWPVFLLDDLAAELDQTHQTRLLERLHRSGAQVFVTGTQAPAALASTDWPTVVFHVEQGRIGRSDVR
ncbi:DNA replication/repair protein RecF [Luteimonas sp. M1R5S18]|uniref:DNA replication and repair protein RecF n=1 Tax=Luteimonas rhizosphaericola TaxID=3042024 RepID=A0ABT6JJ87_9GAMM|nr:DNA replication/repair protein RecF [Luteimonas rhizosphaericola]MDH5830738.1 DNA replication/repair protein RecF [Luteimonas rhizosphaericola]